MSDQPVITNFDIGTLELMNVEYRDVTLNAGGAVTYPEGQVLAFDATAAKWKITQSGTPAVANAKAVLAEETVFSGADDKLVRAIIVGRVREEKLVFDGSDTIDTIPAGVDDSFRTMLRAYGIIAESLPEQRYLDNQP